MHKVEIKGKAQLFQNPVLEALSRTSPAITLVAYVPLLVALLAIGVLYYPQSAGRMVYLFLLGFVSWSLMEYLMHRFFMHFVNDNNVVQRFHYMIHGVHHHYPKDEGRLFMPPLPGYIINAVLFSAIYLLMGPPAFVFFPGMMAGYLCYVFTHYAIHRYKRPKYWIGYIWDHHNTHHFRYPNKAFGVSSPLWDFIFGTMPPRK